MDFDVELDTLGLECPVPVIKTAKRIKDLDAGQVLKVISDSESIEEKLLIWTDTTGNEFLGVEEVGETFICYVRKAG